MTRNGAAAEGSMLVLFSDRLPGRLRREPGLSWGDSVEEGKVSLKFKSSEMLRLLLTSTS